MQTAVEVMAPAVEVTTAEQTAARMLAGETVGCMPLEEATRVARALKERGVETTLI